MIPFLFSVVVELKTFRNAYKFLRMIEKHDVISHEQSDFMENLSAATMKHALIVM
jgi:hypothetical protein